MTKEVAEKAVDFLIEESGDMKRLNITFFGGEPLLNFKLIKHTVNYARKKCDKKKIHFGITTNGTLLTDEIIEYINKNRFGVILSMDGPKKIQDENRPFSNGAGSYDLILPKLKKLLESRNGRVTARATMTKNDIHFSETIKHLVGLGFKSIHIEPASTIDGELGITKSDINVMKKEYKKISEFFLYKIRNKEHFGFSNIIDLMGKTYCAAKRVYGCGAGRGYLAVSSKGDVYPCHRFVGIEKYKMGTIYDFDRTLQKKILKYHVDLKKGCRRCWARYFCGSGCLYEAELYNEDITKPYHGKCSLYKHILELSMWVYSEIHEEDKETLDRMYERMTRPYMKDGHESS